MSDESNDELSRRCQITINRYVPDHARYSVKKSTTLSIRWILGY